MLFPKPQRRDGDGGKGASGYPLLSDNNEKENKEIEDKEQKTYDRLKSKESDRLPQPTGWRILLLPFKMNEKTKGGLILGQDTLYSSQLVSSLLFRASFRLRNLF